VAATGLSADPSEYRARLAEQSDEQIDLWAQEMMRDVAKRRGVIRVLEDLRRAARLSEADIERAFASGNGPMASLGRDAQGRQMMPAVALHAMVPGIRAVGTAGSASSTISSRTSTSSSTSDGPARALGLVRLVHPFPSVLDGVVVGAVALLAGGGVDAALRLGGSMVALQASIGALNDLRDAAADVGRIPPKPIPAGLVRPSLARWVAVTAAGVGLLLAATVGPAVVGLAVLVLVIGYAYDLVAKGTPWSWLPFAVGIPILPVYGWVGAVGRVPDFFAALIPMAMLAGAALSIANARVDLERDRAAGRASIATWLGSSRAWRVHALAWATVVLVALGWLVAQGATASATLIVAAAVVPLAIAVAASGSSAVATRERAWEVEAVAVAVALVAWLWAVSGT
jgi:4-hydroxybenzoate polyprenyltransferase